MFLWLLIRYSGQCRVCMRWWIFFSENIPAIQWFSQIFCTGLAEHELYKISQWKKIGHITYPCSIKARAKSDIGDCRILHQEAKSKKCISYSWLARFIPKLAQPYLWNNIFLVIILWTLVGLSCLPCLVLGTCESCFFSCLLRVCHAPMPNSQPYYVPRNYLLCSHYLIEGNFCCTKFLLILFMRWTWTHRKLKFNSDKNLI